MATLKIQLPGEGTKIYRIHKKLTSLGRSDDADVPLPDASLSDSPAHIHFDGREFNLSATDRDAEILVNGRKRTKHRLAHEDRIRIGSVELEFSLYDHPATDEPAAGDATTELASYKKLYEFSGKLMSSYELPALVDQLLDVMIQVSNADKGFLVLMESGEPVVKAARNLRRETIADGVSQLSDSILAHVVKTRQPLIISDALNDEEFRNSLSVVNFKLTSVMCVPLLERGNMLGVIYVGNDSVAQLFKPPHLEVLSRLRLAGRAAGPQRAAGQRAATRQPVAAEAHRADRFGEIMGSSPRMQDIFRKVQKVAATDISVLITGETGTGKELIARELHSRSNRAKQPFVTINCGAIPENLLESELFGHVRGAFTGAVSNKMGRFQAADRGTLFLDEIGEMPLTLQVKLLRALQEKVVVRVGDTKPETVDIRILAATNRDLDDEMKAGRFREDLYYRLNVVNLAPAAAARPRRRRGRAGSVHGGAICARVRRAGPGLHAQRDRRHQAAPLAGQHPPAREPHQEGGRAGRPRAAGPRGPGPVAGRPAGNPAAGGRQGEVPARVHQRGARRSTTATAPRPPATWASTRAPSSATSRRATAPTCRTTAPTRSCRTTEATP